MPFVPQRIWNAEQNPSDLAKKISDCLILPSPSQKTCLPSPGSNYSHLVTSSFLIINITILLLLVSVAWGSCSLVYYQLHPPSGTLKLIYTSACFCLGLFWVVLEFRPIPRGAVTPAARRTQLGVPGDRKFRSMRVERPRRGPGVACV